MRIEDILSKKESNEKKHSLFKVEKDSRQEEIRSDNEDGREKFIRSLIRDFESRKSVEEKLSILESLCKMEPDEKVLDFVERFSEDLVAQKEKIWKEDEEYADEFESVADSDDTIMRPFVSRLIDILAKTKGTGFQRRGEEILIKLLKNWNDFEANYFYNLLREPNNLGDEGQTKEMLAENEFDSIHKEFGFDEKVDDFPEDIKSQMSVNFNFIRVKNKAIESLGEIGTRRTIDFLLEEVIKGKRSAHNKELANAFYKIDPEYAKRKLVELIGDKNEIVKINSAMIIYRLQLKKIAETEDLATDIFEGHRFHGKDRLFLEYARTIGEIKREAKELSDIYEEVFYEKKLDRNEIVQAILERASRLLLEGSRELEQADDSKREAIVEKIIDRFEENIEVNKREIEELRNIAQQLTNTYKSIYIGSDDGSRCDNYNAFHLEEVKELILKPMIQYELDLAKQKKEVEGEEREEYFLKRMFRYDTDKINEEITYIKEFIEKLKNNNKTIDHFLANPKGSLHGPYSSEIKDSIKKFGLEETLKWAKSEKVTFQDLIEKNENKLKKMEQVIPFQTAFEKKLESLILGKETAVLEKDMFSDIEEEVEKIRPEKFPSDKQIYFPVGISSNLPEWEKIFAGKERMAKPIDIYGYMFWLNNQKKNIKLVVCDQMQASNYEVLYKKSYSEALEAAKKIGEKERRFYQRIIDTFGLENIEVVDYESFIGDSRERFEKYKLLCERLSKSPVWRGAFSEMIQESVAKKVSNEERDNLLRYGIEEISWILSFDGVKVSHIKEARYDALASVLSNTEKICKQEGIDIFESADEQKMMPIMSSVVRELRNVYNASKLKKEKEKGKDSCSARYYEKMHQYVSKIKCGKEKEGVFKVRRRDIETNFVCPDVWSMSFGWRSGKSGVKETSLKIKEAYSTYFCKGGASMFLDSDQVVASPRGHIGGKILTFESEKQRKYVEKVIKPILVQYFKVIESAPEEYFEKIKKTREELLSECKNLKTLSDVLKFIQFNIVNPTFSEYSK